MNALNRPNFSGYFLYATKKYNDENYKAVHGRMHDKLSKIMESI